MDLAALMLTLALRSSQVHLTAGQKQRGTLLVFGISLFCLSVLSGGMLWFHASQASSRPASTNEEHCSRPSLFPTPEPPSRPTLSPTPTPFPVLTAFNGSGAHHLVCCDQSSRYSDRLEAVLAAGAIPVARKQDVDGASTVSAQSRPLHGERPERTVSRWVSDAHHRRWEWGWRWHGTPLSAHTARRKPGMENHADFLLHIRWGHFVI